MVTRKTIAPFLSVGMAGTHPPSKKKRAKRTKREPAVLVQNSRASRQGEVKRAKVSFKELQKSYSWTDNSWQMKALRALDGGDRKISVKEMKAARKRVGTALLTPIEIHDTALKVKKPAGEVNIGSLRGKRYQEIATLADKATGKADGVTSRAEVHAFGKALAMAKNPNELFQALSGADQPQQLYFMSNQRLALLADYVARKTGEPVASDVRVTGKGTVDALLYPAMFVLVRNDGNNVAELAVTQFFYEDRLYFPKYERKDNFYHEPALKAVGRGVGKKPFSGKYQMSKYLEDFSSKEKIEWAFHKGHLLAFLDFISQDDGVLSFTMANMHAQTATSNSNIWLRFVEKPIRANNEANQSRMVMATAAVFLDQDLKPLPRSKMKWIAGNVNKKGVSGPSPEALRKQGLEKFAAVPSHSLKVVLEQRPDNTFTAVAYIVENRMKLTPEVKAKQLKKLSWVAGGREKIADLLRREGAAKLSLQQFEMLTGKKPFVDLPEDVRKGVAGEPEVPFKPKKKLDFISLGEKATTFS